MHSDIERGWSHARSSDTGERADTDQTAPPRHAVNVAGWSASVLAHAAALALLAGRFSAKHAHEPTIVPPIAIEVMTPAQRAQAAPHAAAPPRQSTPTQAAQPHPHRVAPPARPPVMRAPLTAATAHPTPPVAASTPPARDAAAASAQASAAASSAPPAAPASAPAAATAEPPVTPPIGNAAYLHNPPPHYPQSAQEEGWEGRVVLRVHVDASGHPVEIALHASSSHEALDKAALTAVRQWTFVPAKRGSTPTDGWVDVPLDFRLN